MTEARWTQIQDLFEAAQDRPPDEQSAYLRRACGRDRALYDEVMSLLTVEPHPLFSGSALGAVGLPEDLFGAPTADGERIGPYRVVRRLGAGGMGTVYLAERADEQFEQTVALKLIKRGMDTEAVLARFQAERQILARLQHPHVARLLDGGMSGDGRPYFAMEYVDGVPITDYADRHRLPVDARLRLFEAVCEAVAYAHQNLVVHRDLKPSNILVAAGGQVKLLDFGIAKVLADGDGGDALTRPGRPVLTPAYAAPEQLAEAPVTTATDVYGLGAVLFELLSGRRPDADDAPRPAAGVDADAAHARSTTPEKLRRRLRGDLGRVLAKALHTDPARRYATAEGFLADLRAVQQDRPVQARPDAASYRLRTYVRRHRTGVLASAGVLVLLAALVGFYTARLADERDRARLEAGKAEQVAAFLTSILEGADPLDAPGETLSADALLERGAARIGTDLADQPALRAAMQHLMGGIYENLGRYDAAEPLLREALAGRRALLGDRHAETAATARRLGTLLRRMGRPEEAEPLLREALAVQRAVLPPDDPETAHTMRHLASLLRDQGDYAAAERLYRDALGRARAALGDDHADVVDIKNSLSILLEHVGRFDEAATLAREIVDADRRVRGPDAPALAGSLSTLSTLLREQGDLAGAEEAVREALRINRLVYGDDHLETATSLRQLASVLRDGGRYDEAAALYDEALAIRRAALGPDHPRVANLLNSVGQLRLEQGDVDGALALYGESLRIYRAQPRPEPNRLAPALHNLAGVYEDAGRRAEAEALYRESLDLLRRTMPPGSADLAFPLVSLGTLLARDGRATEAVPLLEEALAIRRAALPEGHRYTAQAEHRLAEARTALAR